MDTPSPSPDELKQGIRLRRFLLAGSFSALYLAVLSVFYAQDQIDRQTLVEVYAIVAAFVVFFFCVFRFGFNLRFPDPSLTGWQFIASVFTMLYVVYRAPDTRLVFTAFFFVALMFCMLRHSGRMLAGLSAVSLASYALVVWVRYTENADVDALRSDALHLCVLLVTTPWFVLIGEHVKRLRRGLTEASIRLEGIEESARRDDLTGVYNRRALIVAMEDAKRWADAAREPLSLCVIDLDRFKRYNDEFDHLTGDQVLRSFAQTVQSGLRATDVFGRYGGEEFVQILRHSTAAGAMADAERLRERISEVDIPVTRSAGRLTVSIGVAQYKPGEAIIDTFARADEALYRAKQRGRNRVECEVAAVKPPPPARGDKLARAPTHSP
jgi:diguanylate cyclase (GGDEF)-like protein